MAWIRPKWARRGLAVLAWAGAVVALVTYFGHVWDKPSDHLHAVGVGLYWASGILAFLNAVARGGVLQGLASRSTSAAIRGVLREIVEHCSDHSVEWARSSAVSANVMLLEDGVLREIVRYPRRVSRFGGLTWRVGEGACGTAVRSGQPCIINLHAQGFTGKHYAALTEREDGQPWWGITQREWEHTRDLAVVISLPLFDVEDEATVIGVVNIDTRAPLAEWPHSDEDVLGNIQRHRWRLAQLLDKGWGGDIWDGN